MSALWQKSFAKVRALRGPSSSMRFALALSGIFSLAAILAAWISYSILSDELRSRLFDDAHLTATSLADLRTTAGNEDFLRQLDYRATRSAAENELVAFVTLEISDPSDLSPGRRN